MVGNEHAPMTQEAIFARTKIADLSSMAEAILDERGSDHSTDDDFLFEAAWESEQMPLRSYELSQEINDQGYFCYWLEVYGEAEDLYDRIGFTPETGALSREVEDPGSKEADDQEIVNLFYYEDAVQWGRLERRLFAMLRTAPGIAFENISRDDEGWRQQFGELVVHIAATDRETAGKSSTGGAWRRRAKQRLRQKCGLNGEQLTRALDLMAQRANDEEEDNGEA